MFYNDSYEGLIIKTLVKRDEHFKNILSNIFSQKHASKYSFHSFKNVNLIIANYVDNPNVAC